MIEVKLTTQEQLWRAAWIIAEQYGDEAVEFADQMVESFEIGGKLGQRDIWLSIKNKISVLTGEGAGGPSFWQ
jgi:hypothetical protein